MKVKTFSVLLSVCCASALFGIEGGDANKTNTLKAVSVSATNLKETPIDDVSKPVSIIIKEELDTKAPTSIVEAMKDTPGVNFSRAGGLGGQLVMRGFNSNDLKIPMAINGERFRGRNTLEYNIIDPQRVEKIEIIRGPAAAIYGSEAMAGMVNIVMKKPSPNFDKEFSFSAMPTSVQYESVNNLYGVRTEIEGGGQGYDALLGMSYKSAGDYKYPGGEAENSDFLTKNLDGTIGYSLDTSNRVEVNFKLSETNTNRAGGLGAAPGMQAPQASKIYMREDPILEKYANIAYSGVPDIRHINKIDASLYVRKLWTDVVTTKYPNTTSASETHRYVVGPLMNGGKAFLVSDIVPSTLVTTGIDFYLQDWAGAEQETKGSGSVASVARKKVEADSTQDNYAAFLLAEHELTNWLLLSANARYDYYKTENDADVVTIPALTQKIQENKSKSEDIMTYALGAVLKPLDWLNFTLNYATTYRTPTVNELFGYGVYGKGYLIPNPELEAEKGNTIDFSTRFRFDDLSANLTLYKSSYTDMISYEEITYLELPSRQRINIGKAEVEGLEIDSTYRLTKEVSLKAGVAYTKGTDTTTVDKPLKYIAPFTANAGVRYDVSSYYLEADGRYGRKKDRIDTTAERETEEYTVFDIYAGSELNRLHSGLPKATLRLGVENLFDKKYVDPTTQESISVATSDTNPLVEPGRNFKITLSAKF